MFETYGENDTRNRVGKQLCIKDPGPSSVGGVPIAAAGGPVLSNYAAFLNQGCLAGSLYQNAAYGTVNSNATFLATGNLIGLNNGEDVFAKNPLQDHNLHNISSVIQPNYTVDQNLVELHMEYKITDSLTLTSITGFNRDGGTSVEDYNRIVPTTPFTPVGNSLFGPYALAAFPNGVVADPQTGTSNLFRTFDGTTYESKEYTEELRLSSSFSGKFNFSAGLFYNEDTSTPGGTNYYVESNALTAAAYASNYFSGALAGGPVYVDPSSSPNGSGHNYYDSRSGGGYLKSYAVFGEGYYNITPDLKLTLGGRYTVDQLYNVSYPISVIIGANNGTTPFPNTNTNPLLPNGGYGGFPPTTCTTSLAACLTQQYVTYREFTGRANLDWTPTLPFTDKTLVYATYSRGYKGGGFNTPCQVGGLGAVGGACPYPSTFAPEFINAYEIGTKNTLMGGRLTLNLNGFYYDYTGYQVSEIVDKSSVNLNVNAKIYGAEFESVFAPVRNLTVNANVGFLHSSIDNGQTSVDEINLNQGNPNYTLLHADDGTSCLAPTQLLAGYIAEGLPAPFLSSGNIPGVGQAFPGACTAAGYALVGANPAYINGVPEQLGGKKLPNTPEFTVSLGAQYVFTLTNDWKATVRGDYYWQDSSYARIFNAVNDYLQAYHVVNATVTIANVGQGLEIQGYVKNALNAQPITGVYLTNDTSGLFQNVFTLDPRTYGLRVTKRF
jgi:outer membrane receptor protein involved in Fe transport